MAPHGPESSTGGGHSHGGTDANGVVMAMVFQNFIKTPLYTNDWTPTTPGAYAGTCIFLIALAMFGRSLMAVKAMLDQRWLDQARDRKFVVVAGQTTESQRAYNDPSAKDMVLLTENGVEEKVRVVTRTAGPAVMPWRFSVDLPRAAMVTLMVGVGYLL